MARYRAKPFELEATECGFRSETFWPGGKLSHMQFRLPSGELHTIRRCDFMSMFEAVIPMVVIDDCLPCPTCGSHARRMSVTTVDDDYYCETCHLRFNIKELR